MGYRSEWKIVFNTHNKADEVMAWLKSEAQQINDLGRLIDEMLKCAITHVDDDVIELGDDGWKLGYWDALISFIHEKWDSDPEVDFASLRLGEDHDDNDLECGDYTYLYICRSIGDSDLSAVPAASEIETVNIACDVPKEESCGTCNKTKDIGKSCWWCGNV